MPARLNPRQDERCRAAIQTTQLCKRLNYFALGLPEPITGRPPEMTDTQVRAAAILLRKTLPDLAVTQLTGADGNNLIIDFRWADAAPSAPGHAPPVIDAKAEPEAGDTETGTELTVTWAEATEAAD
jgi:hypothetical protein